MWIALLLALTPGLAACAGGGGAIATNQPETGSNEVLRGQIDGAPGRELVVGDLVFGPGAPTPLHDHPGEEFLYAIGGETVVSCPGVPEVVLHPCDSLSISPVTVNLGHAGVEGVRAISGWVATQGQPMRVDMPK